MGGERLGLERSRLDPSPDSATVGLTSPFDGTDGPEPLVESGAMVGRFIVDEEIGAGGMGRVFRAYDPRLERSVAVKLLRHRTSSEDRLRVTREAQAMAALSNPNIVTVFDIGEVNVGGRASMFIAMELIEGQTLSQWCATPSRTTDEILAVFVGAGAGLHAAHTEGIVHRDFKPSNVLVDADGRARVLDFGLARAMEADSLPPESVSSESSHSHSQLSHSMTMTGAVLGTPAYMAPEQHAGMPLDHRCDQYAFCVSLWEMLTGARPFAERDFDALVQAKAESRFVSEDDGALPRELQQVLERGMAPDPDARYESMAALLEALRGVRRRRGSRLLAVLGIAGLVTGASALLWLGAERPEEPSCDGAVASLDGIWDETVKATSRAAIEGTGRAYASQTWSRIESLVDDYAVRWVSTRTGVCEATLIHGTQSEALMDQQMGCLDDRLARLAALTSALEAPDAKFLTRAVEAASHLPPLEVCTDVDYVGRRHPVPADPETRQLVEALKTDLGRVRVLQHTGDYAEALALVQQLAERSSAVDYPPLLVEIAQIEGVLHHDLGHYEPAAEILSRAYFDAKSAGLDGIAAEVAARLTLVVGKNLGKTDEALEVWAKHASAALELFDEPGTEVELYDSVAVIHRARGDHEKALEYQRRALAILDEAQATGLARSDSLHGLGVTLFGMGQREEGIAQLKEVLALREQALGDLHPRVAAAVTNLGTAYSAVGDYKTALEFQRRALSIYAQSMDNNHPTSVDTRYNMANTLQRMGDLDGALQTHREVLAAHESLYGPDHKYTGDSLYAIGTIHHDRKEFEDAAEYHSRARVVFESALGSQHAYVADALVGVGRAREALGQWAAAVEALEPAVAIREEKSSDELPAARFALARALVGAKRESQRARALAMQARQGYVDTPGAHDEAIAAIDAWLAERPASRSVSE